jgi:hypothetical protein
VVACGNRAWVTLYPQHTLCPERFVIAPSSLPLYRAEQMKQGTQYNVLPASSNWPWLHDSAGPSIRNATMRNKKFRVELIQSTFLLNWLHVQSNISHIPTHKNSFLALSPFSKGTELVLPTGAHITNLVSLRFVSYINRICTYNTLDNIAFWKRMNHL